NLDEMEDAFGCLKSPSSFGPMDRFTSVVDKGNNKEADVCNVIRQEQVVKLKEYICRFAYECAISFNVFEKDCFKKLLEAVGQFGPRALPPTRYEMGDTFLKKEVERTNDLLSRYRQEWKSNGCSIMTDAWSDRKRRSIMNLCVNSKLGTVFLSSKECSNEAHTSQHIFEYVDSCIEEVGPENVVQVVTDNASNNIRASTLLKAKRPTIFWTSCATHTINLMLEVKVLRMVDADWKPSMGFIYGEHKKAKKDIIDALSNNRNAYEPIMDIISKKSSKRLDTCLHMVAYILNPYYLYNDLEAKQDVDADDAVTEVVETLFPEDHMMQNKILMVELPIYKSRLENFDRLGATKACEVNDKNYDPGSYKKRNRLEATKMNNLVYVQFNANLMEKNKKRMARGHEVLLADDASGAQEWIVENDEVANDVDLDRVAKRNP
nr:hypothetical protein [Tanacetum cinerariifolium]